MKQKEIVKKTGYSRGAVSAECGKILSGDILRRPVRNILDATGDHKLFIEHINKFEFDISTNKKKQQQ